MGRSVAAARGRADLEGGNHEPRHRHRHRHRRRPDPHGRVGAVVYFKVVAPVSAVVQVQNYTVATSQISQTTLRAVLSKADLDEILTQRDRLNIELQQIIDDVTEPWGVKVERVEIKDVD